MGRPPTLDAQWFVVPSTKVRRSRILPDADNRSDGPAFVNHFHQSNLESYKPAAPISPSLQARGHTLGPFAQLAFCFQPTILL
ncbi:predicted protein [Plenodomus lingam JN3]|uniref:Uncharacterized protein n=1 Tax=Leptosphaeria maculans (strain JN3 / isolate v23.1.3 / race Av1-4-5-6-7-8) TaxID=985895 RepID=E5A690_LEPMJ|nr:predicted protein [Plenodomus lingam JN3]CBX99135.1 predicted protein [Plenodomus lingam JN3]